jgi:hypothetical protein
MAIEFVSALPSSNGWGFSTGANTGVHPDNVLMSNFYVLTGVVHLQLRELQQNRYYDVTFTGSRAGTGNRTSIYSISSDTVTLDALNNSTQTVTIDSVIPDDNGVIDIYWQKTTAAEYGYLAALVVRSYSIGQIVTVAPRAQISRVARPGTTVFTLDGRRAGLSSLRSLMQSPGVYVVKKQGSSALSRVVGSRHP